MADNGPVRGTMVIRPYGYAIWERMQADMDARIKASGAQNAYFPLFIPESYLQREAEHVEGFSPELAVVTHAGGEELAEPVVVRPTSETVIGEFMAKWIQSYRDLPLLLNQWANVVRWELRPRLFLRSSEFLWQEGHTAHASYEDAAAYARRIHTRSTTTSCVDVLAMPRFLGIKPASERFPGAINSMTGEGMMRDGKALQMATSHELGRTSRAPSTSSTRARRARRPVLHDVLGGLHPPGGRAHHGPRRRPRPARAAAPRPGPGRRDAGARRRRRSRGRRVDSRGDCGEAGVRVEVDRGRGSFGRRVTDWEIKGVPLRVEVGPRDLASGVVTLVRRDTGDKLTPTASAHWRARASGCSRNAVRPLRRRAGLPRRAHRDVATIDEAREAAQSGFARLAWSVVEGEGEARCEDALGPGAAAPRWLIPTTRPRPTWSRIVGRATERGLDAGGRA